MTKQTRYLALGSTAIVVFGLCTGLVAYYGGIPSLTASHVGPSELSYIPADASIVAFADVRDVMNSELRAKLRDVLPGDQQKREELQRMTGIDIERDIDRVVAAVSAEGEKSTVALLSGRFNPTQIESLARQHGGEVSEYEGKRLIRGMGQRNGNHQGSHVAALAFIQPNILAIGEETAVKRAIDTQIAAKQVANITSNGDLMKMVDKVSTGNNVWAVGRMDSFTAKLPQEVSSRMPAVQWFAATGKVNGGIHASLIAEARDNAAAEALRDIVKGGLALVKLQASDPKFAALAQSIRLEGTGRTVQVSFSVPADMLNMFLELGKAHHGEMRNR